MRSFETIKIRCDCCLIEKSVFGSILKFSCVEKRMARIMRRGSSEKVVSGSKGVRIILLFKSFKPEKGSINSP